MEAFGMLIANHLPALIAMVIGYGLLVVEMYIPGFGAPGILGTILAILGVVFMEPTPLQALFLVAIFVALLCIALAICLRSASRGRFARSRFVLKDVATPANIPENNDLTYFVGKIGETSTALRPAGIAEFDGVKLSVVSDGEFIEKKQSVQVRRVEGKRILVVPTDGAAQNAQ